MFGLIIGIILSTVGIVITVALSDPAIKWFRHRKEKRKRQKWSVDLHVDEGQVQKLKHYAYEFWQQEINVDADGNADHRVDACIINIGDKLLERVTFPIYCDAQNIPATDVKPWAACGKTLLNAQVEDWIAESARGRVAILIVPPLSPGERRKIQWGYRLPQTFTVGDEYYNWDIATLHYEIRGSITFSKPWTIHYARWDPELAATQSPPIVEDGKIKWIVRFPERGKKITMRFGLSKEMETKSKSMKVISTGQGAFINEAYRITSQEGEVDSVIRVPKSPRVITALTNRKLELWDVNSTHRINLFNEDVVYPHERLSDFTISHDGRFVALVWEDGACNVWDLKTGMCHPYLNDPMFSAVVLSGGKKLITTGDEEGTLLIWGLKKGDRDVDTIRVACKELLEKIVLLPDEKHVLFTSWDNTIGLCNLDSGKIVGRLYGHTGRVKCLAVDSAGKYVVSGSADESIRLWDVSNQDCICTLKGHRKWIICVDITPDGQLAVSSDGDTVKLWELTKGECLLSIKTQLSSTCFTGNGDQLVIAAGRDLRVYDLKI